MKRCTKAIVGACFLTTGFSSFSAYSIDLIQVYQQALRSDPIFAQAQSTWQSQKMNLPIAEAGYLPQVSIQGNATRAYNATNPPSSTVNSLPYSWQYGYALTATQPIFNGIAWAQIKGADATVKSATATYLAAQQSLMQRTVTAYLAVLQAYDQLRYAIATKNAVLKQFRTSNKKYSVGLIAITSVYDARSRYDQVVAQQIIAQNNLSNQLENLRAITGYAYKSLKRLRETLPLVSPQPRDVNRWVKISIKQNYSLQAQNYNVIAAMETIKQEAAGGYPQLGLQAGLSDDHTVGNPGDTSVDARNLGLTLSYAPIQGGLVIASTEQARYNYVTAAGLLQQIYRQLVDQTRSSFFNVISNISSIKTDKESIVSATNTLHSTEGGMRVGTRTMVDVLIALTALYQVQLQYVNDKYAYLNNFIALKAAAGTLSIADLEVINSLLSKSVRFPEQMTAAHIPTVLPNATLDYSNDDYIPPKNTIEKMIFESDENKKISDDQPSSFSDTENKSKKMSRPARTHERKEPFEFLKELFSSANTHPRHTPLQKSEKSALQ